MTRGPGTRRPVRIVHVTLAAVIILMPWAAAAQTAPAMPRVRSENPSIARLIAEARSASTTFRGVVDAIDNTNGIVYVQSGQCRHGAHGCLTHNIQVAEPNRILYALVNTQRDSERLMATIGHELHHAVEVLRDPRITTTQEMFFYLFGMSMSATGRFETKEAEKVGMQIEQELRTTVGARRLRSSPGR